MAQFQNLKNFHKNKKLPQKTKQNKRTRTRTAKATMPLQISPNVCNFS